MRVDYYYLPPQGLAVFDKITDKYINRKLKNNNGKLEFRFEGLKYIVYVKPDSSMRIICPEKFKKDEFDLFFANKVSKKRLKKEIKEILPEEKIDKIVYAAPA